MSTSSTIRKKAKNIKLLIMDVDGVLTPGCILINDHGKEIKVFNVQDGFGITLWKRAGLKSAIITAGKAPAVKYRAEHLKVDKVYQRACNKLSSYKRLKETFSIHDEEVCFIGDDLIDIPLLKRAGLACVVADAHRDVKKYASYICKNPGGKGAVREAIDMILRAKGLWDKITGGYTA